MMKNLKPVIVLSSICLIVALLLGVVNMITAKEIEKELLRKSNAAKAEVLPSANIDTFSENILDQIKNDNSDIPKEITAIFKADTGYVFQAKVSGNAPGMIIMCGINNDGLITGVKDIANGETPSYWAKVAKLLGGKNSSYTGSSASDLDPQLIGGATNSSTGIYNAVKASVKAYNLIKGNEVDEEEKDPVIEDIVTPHPKHKDEALELAKAMYEGDVTLELENVYNPSPTTVSVYKNAEDGSYVFYIATRTQYTPLETEALILVDSTGKVVKVNLLEWVVGHGVNYTPEYLNSFIEKSRYTIDDVNFVAGATATSNNLASALKTALFEVFGSRGASQNEIDELAYRVVPYGDTLEKMTIPENAPETVKNMYKLKSGRGYVFFVSTKTQYAPCETEAFVYTDINGKILEVKIISWIVGHGVYPTDSYAEGLKGKTIEQLRGNGEDLNPEIDQVAGATGTSAHLEHAIADALSIVPEHTNYSLIGIIIISCIVVLTVSVSVVYYVKRRVIR